VDSSHATPRPRSRFPWSVAALVVVVMAVTAWFLIALSRAVPPPALDVGAAATVLRVPQPVTAFTLRDHHGQTFDRSRLAGLWSFVFFGYTSCPAVCPMTLGNLADVAELLEGTPGAGDEVQFVFVSVDPDRDSTERLATFGPYFDADFIGATGTDAQLEELTDALGIYHARHEDESEIDYLVDHTTSVLLIDPERRLHAIFPTPHDPDAMAEAFRKIRAHAG